MAKSQLKHGHQAGIEGRSASLVPSSFTYEINDGVVRIDDANNPAFWIQLDIPALRNLCQQCMGNSLGCEACNESGLS